QRRLDSHVANLKGTALLSCAPEVIAPAPRQGIEDVIERDHAPLSASMEADIERDDQGLLGDEHAFGALFRRKLSVPRGTGTQTLRLGIEGGAEEPPHRIGCRCGWPLPPDVVVGV